MRINALAISALLVAGCGGNGSMTVTPSSTPPSDNGGGGGGGGMPGGGGGGGGMPGGGGGGGMPGGGGGGGAGGGGAGGGGGGSGGGGGPVAGPCSTTPQRLATQHYLTEGVSVDDTNVYFSAHDSEQAGSGSLTRVYSVPIAGGTPVAIGVGDANGGEPYVTSNATAAFLAQPRFDGSAFGSILRFAKDGSTRLQLANDNMFCMEDARGYIYYCGSRAIYRVPEDGGAAPTTVVTTNGLPPAIAFDNTQMWFGDEQTIKRTPADGGGPVAIVVSTSDGGDITDVAVDDRNVYFAAFNGLWSRLYVADKYGGSAARELDGSSSLRLSNIKVDAGNVYLTIGASTIGRIAPDGSITYVVQQATNISTMTLRGDSLFYTDLTDGGVYRVCK